MQFNNYLRSLMETLVDIQDDMDETKPYLEITKLKHKEQAVKQTILVYLLKEYKKFDNVEDFFLSAGNNGG